MDLKNSFITDYKKKLFYNWNIISVIVVLMIS